MSQVEQIEPAVAKQLATLNALVAKTPPDVPYATFSVSGSGGDVLYDFVFDPEKRQFKARVKKLK